MNWEVGEIADVHLNGIEIPCPVQVIEVTADKVVIMPYIDLSDPITAGTLKIAKIVNVDPTAPSMQKAFDPVTGHVLDMKFGMELILKKRT